jgi:enamine deaminase RidA (YjgF/YER057c/UK114 family)
MWRGVTRWKPILSGATMLRAGWLATGKLVHYPIRNDVDETADGTKRQLVNWLWEIETPQYKRWDWNRPARVEDFVAAAEGWRFDWLDVPAFLRAAELVLEYPMVDKDPLPAWSFGRVTLLGDAAHPMVPRGSNGAGQHPRRASWRSASRRGRLKRYKPRGSARLGVLEAGATRDAILREVYERTATAVWPHRGRDQRAGARRAVAALQAGRRLRSRNPPRRPCPMSITRHDPTSILSNAVQHGDTVYLAGVVAKNLGEDVKGQSKQILDEIDRLLDKCGSSKSKVLSATIWVTASVGADERIWTAWASRRTCPHACRGKLADPRRWSKSW